MVCWSSFLFDFKWSLWVSPSFLIVFAWLYSSKKESTLSKTQITIVGCTSPSLSRTSHQITRAYLYSKVETTGLCKHVNRQTNLTTDKVRATGLIKWPIDRPTNLFIVHLFVRYEIVYKGVVLNAINQEVDRRMLSSFLLFGCFAVFLSNPTQCRNVGELYPMAHPAFSLHTYPPFLPVHYYYRHQLDGDYLRHSVQPKRGKKTWFVLFQWLDDLVVCFIQKSTFF